jgi:transcriptional regulator of met regulon
LDQCGKHNTDAKKITDVGKVNVKIPTDCVNIVKNSQTCNNTHESKRAVNGVKNQLCCSVFNHNKSP